MTNIFEQLLKENSKVNTKVNTKVNQDDNKKYSYFDLDFTITDGGSILSLEQVNDTLQTHKIFDGNKEISNDIKNDIITTIKNNIPQYRILIESYYAKQDKLVHLEDKLDYLIEQIKYEKDEQVLIKLIQERHLTYNNIQELKYFLLVINKKLLREQEVLTELIEKQTGLTLKQPLFKLKKPVENMSIQITNTDHVPKENHFYEIVTSNIKNVTYNPEKEKEKYSYDKINKLRKNNQKDVEG